ncbi:FtsB family cell division protein [Nocardia vermiculata]|uniref:Septum formation initiator family protein n=1 Tax=Nocardia vermiculata TaxID=257274 RepID=A0A846XP94_9NOCA|nr:septum formation initiator family protein [Nocardia vermiculata]NKY48853.1 septum formation initiator family protein [Nocardia vermiculata]
MTERRARGTSPAGRGDRRSSRSAKAKPARSGSARTAAGQRAGRRRSPATKTGTRRPRSKKTDSDRRILGLSTGRAVILAAVLCGLALTLAVPMRTYFSQRSEATQLAEQRRELESDLARLRDRRAQQQDPAYIRSEARDRLRLVMPGETAYIVQVPGIEQPAVPVPTTRARTPDPWYTQLWRSMSEPQPQPETTTPPPPAAPPPPSPEGEPR